MRSTECVAIADLFFVEKLASLDSQFVEGTTLGMGGQRFDDVLSSPLFLRYLPLVKGPCI